VTVVLVPVRGFTTGKTRWGDKLPPDQHRALVRRMADAALTAAGDHDVRVVTADGEVEEWAGHHGAGVMHDRGDGLNPALEQARAEALREGAPSVLVLFADLPRVSKEDVAAMLDLPHERSAVIAPDHHGTGTNALHVGAACPLRYRFGTGSFELHRAQVNDALVVSRPGLAFDVDEAPDPSIVFS